MSVVAQITVLLALSAGLFDGVPLERMMEAEQAVRVAALDVAAEVIARFDSADKLSDEDRTAMIQIARAALASFQPKAASEAAKDIGPQAKSAVARAS